MADAMHRGMLVFRREPLCGSQSNPSAARVGNRYLSKVPRHRERTMQLGRFRIGFHKHGNCWRLWKFYRNSLSSGELTFYGWWRFYVVSDRRFA